jgi:hypothetical protein
MITKNNKQIATIAAVLLGACFAGTAHAQYVSSYSQPAPLYPYVAQPQHVYAQPQYAQPYPYVQSPHVRTVPRDYNAPRASEPRRKVSKTDPVLVEELRKGRRKKSAKNNDRDNDNGKDVIVVDKKKVEIDKKIVVREKPIVRKRIRVVENPPIVVQREIDEHGHVLSEQRLPTVQAQAPASMGGGGRVIHAEAEVTIVGPDRMTIRLYRKNDGRDANAKALTAKPKKTKTSKRERSQPET